MLLLLICLGLSVFDMDKQILLGGFVCYCPFANDKTFRDIESKGDIRCEDMLIVMIGSMEMVLSKMFVGV